MVRNYFTDSQIEELKTSPYVSKISRANVSFTKEFKEKFLNLYFSGYGPTQAISSLGINYKLLGPKRIENIRFRFLNESKRPEGFSRKANCSSGKPRKKRVPVFENDSQAAEYYKEYSLRLEQELDLLKKIEALEKAHQSSRAKNSK